MSILKQSAQFDSLVVQSTDEGFLLLGQNLRTAIYFQIEKRHNLRREEIPHKPEVLHRALEDLFGTGSRVIEKRIAQSLYSKIGLEYKDHSQWTIVDYLKDARAANTRAQ